MKNNIENFSSKASILSVEKNNDNREETIEEKVERRLKNLGINFEYLKDKVTLDIGAGLAEVAEVAREKGAKIISLDINPEIWTERDGIELPSVPYVKASAEELPFNSETFDLVISHAGPFSNVPSKEAVAKMIIEAKRTLKKGGELRFGPGNLNARVFSSEELFSFEEQKFFNHNQRIKRITEKSLKFLKEVDPNITQEKIEDPLNRLLSGHFYLLVKDDVDSLDNNG